MAVIRSRGSCRTRAGRPAVPEARWTIVEEVVQGDTVVTRLSVQGTFAGPVVGRAPPGRPATVTGVAISRFAQERLVEVWLQADLLGAAGATGGLAAAGPGPGGGHGPGRARRGAAGGRVAALRIALRP